MLIFSSLIFTSCSNEESNAIAARTASVFRIVGDEVNISRGDNQTSAQPGVALNPGNNISTGADSNCYVNLDNTSLVKLDQLSFMSIDRMSDSLISLVVHEGQILVNVHDQNPEYSLETQVGNVVFGVRGTIFIAGFNSDDFIQLIVIEGSVDYEGRLITAGRKLIVDLTGEVIFDDYFNITELDDFALEAIQNPQEPPQPPNNDDTNESSNVEAENIVRVEGSFHTTIATGANTSFAITNDGTLWGWGSDINGSLGARPPNRLFAAYTPIPIMEDVISVDSAGSQTVAITSDGTLWQWGVNGLDYPTPIMENVNFVSLSSFILDVSGLAITNDHELWAWGSNSSGQLGDGTTTDSDTPILILENVAFAHNGIAIKRDGSVWHWGEQSMIIDGTHTTVSIPTPEPTDRWSANPGLNIVRPHHEDETMLSMWRSSIPGLAGGLHYSFSDASGNFQGFFINDRIPQTFGGSPVISTSSSGNHVLALTEDGTLWSWGNGGMGQLGTGARDEHRQLTLMTRDDGTEFHRYTFDGFTPIRVMENVKLPNR